MKKLLFTLLFITVSLGCGAQVYYNVLYLDKFDDAIRAEKIRTLIIQTDSSFIVEERGGHPKEYCFLTWYDNGLSNGDKDNIVELTRGVYGYENFWLVTEKQYKEAYFNKAYAEQEFYKLIEKYCLAVIHRTVSKSPYTFIYDNEGFMLIDWYKNGRLGENIFRIVYTTHSF